MKIEGVENQILFPHFNGPEYKTKQDHVRLTNQHERIKALMLDFKWRTLDQISKATGDPAASISAQLRHLRKKRFGSYIVNRRAKNRKSSTGLYEYQIEKGEK